MKIKFEPNGVKVDGKLCPAYMWLYTAGHGLEPGAEPRIRVSLKGYAGLPREAFTALAATNHSDSQSDYFDHDSFEIFPGSEHWVGALAAIVKLAGMDVARHERTLAKQTDARRRMWTERKLEGARAEFARFSTFAAGPVSS